MSRVVHIISTVYKKKETQPKLLRDYDRLRYCYCWSRTKVLRLKTENNRRQLENPLLCHQIVSFQKNVCMIYFNQQSLT